ncbi:uncharacterized protein LOC144145423 [Haemaphysalis longicornis]
MPVDISEALSSAKMKIDKLRQGRSDQSIGQRLLLQNFVHKWSRFLSGFHDYLHCQAADLVGCRRSDHRTANVQVDETATSVSRMTPHKRKRDEPEGQKSTQDEAPGCGNHVADAERKGYPDYVVGGAQLKAFRLTRPSGYSGLPSFLSVFKPYMPFGQHRTQKSLEVLQDSQLPTSQSGE